LYSDWLRAGRSRDRIPAGVRFSLPVQTGPGAHPASCTMDTGSFPEVKSGRGMTLTPHPLLVRWSSKGRIYLYSHYGPYGLYKGAHYFVACEQPSLLPPQWFLNMFAMLQKVTGNIIVCVFLHMEHFSSCWMNFH